MVYLRYHTMSGSGEMLAQALREVKDLSINISGKQFPYVKTLKEILYIALADLTSSYGIKEALIKLEELGRVVEGNLE